MKLDALCLTITLLSWAIYRVYVEKTFKPISWSITYYELKNDGKERYFGVFLWSISLPFIYYAIYPFNIYFLITAVSVSLVGVFPLFKLEIPKIFHYTFAIASIASGLIGITVVFGLWYILAGYVIIGILLVIFSKRPFIYLEDLGLITISIFTYLNY